MPDKSRKRQQLSPETLAAWFESFEADAAARRSMNAVARTTVDDVALDRTRLLSVQTSMSHRLDDWKAVDQKRSGRCWLFAALNLLRSDARRALNVKEFEFSQNHAMYWDKLERANFFLEDMIQLADAAPEDRLPAFLLGNVADDGGQWDMEVSVFLKHGAVPKALMPETESSSNTSKLNQSLRRQLRIGARRLREAAQADAGAAELTSLKEEILKETHRILTIHLGVPPTEFEWQYNDDDRVFHREGTFTPQSFLATYTEIDLTQYVCLVDDPRPEHPKGATLTVAHLGNVVGGSPVLYLNVDVQTMKQVAAASIEQGEPVWFGCDVDPQMESTGGIWHAELFDYNGVYGVDLSTTKEERVRFGESAMTHAMLFTGVDLVENTPRRWRVENSWGSEKFDGGFCTMDDSWFDEYVFEVVVRKDRLPQSLQDALATEPLVLPAWDPMGALA
ncbi:aminopeptidase [Galactobacter valiniphilus]|uniref:Aminopeptidase n=1 Tax=Galactobacter valiniphilus TaxID=2676122 RepID=A0A399J6C5_9MICC|nr:C1 family peptidase [Galactobacter valiniphilus]RII41005.1 aminopeptidase [Galactobacter valiniphilus]